MSEILGGTAIADGHPRDVAVEMPHDATRVQMDALQNAILNSADFAIIATDANGVIQVFNSGAERMLGYAASDVINEMTPDKFHDPQEMIARAKALSAEFATTITSNFDALIFRASRGIADNYDLNYIRKDGSHLPARMSITALRGAQNKIIGYLNVVINNSEQIALIAAEKEKERLKDEFVATVSHELRTPLTSIAGAVGLLIGHAAGSLPETATRLLTIAHANIQRLIRLLNDILDSEKMESGKAVFDFKRVEVRALVEQTIEANRAFAEGCNVRIRLDPASTVADVRADPDRLIQVVTNLISNAVKFSPPDQEVVVTVESRGDTVHLSVRDHGHGVPNEFKSRIFQKFAQADATDTRQKGGTGLGLSIVKQIVDRLDGAVSFEDAPAGGTIFHVELPNWAHAVRIQAHASGKSDLRLLLCEDNPEAAIAICNRLLQEGFITDIALTADEAIARVAAVSYVAILVDLQLPEGDYISLIKQLRAQPQIYNTLLVVLSTDLSQPHKEQRAPTLLNIVDWLDKPIDVTRLARVLDRPIARNGRTHPRILHVDSDPDLLRRVASALSATAEVMSVASIEDARRALASSRFDVTVLDVAMSVGSGFDLLHELRDSKGDAIPLVVFSPTDTNPAFAAQVRSALIRSRTSIDYLVATLRRRLAGNSLPSDDRDAA